MGGGDVHPFGQRLFPDDGENDGLAAVYKIHLVIGGVSFPVGKGDEARLPGGVFGIAYRFPLGFCPV